MVHRGQFLELSKTGLALTGFKGGNRGFLNPGQFFNAGTRYLDSCPGETKTFGEWYFLPLRTILNISGEISTKTFTLCELRCCVRCGTFRRALS